MNTKNIAVQTKDPLDPCTPLLSSWKRENIFPAAIKEVYVIFRYGSESKQSFRNAWVLQQKIIQNYGGKFIGFSDNIVNLEKSDWPSNHCIVILCFLSLEQAIRWINSDRIFKQQDMEYEAFVVPLQYIPDLAYTTFMLMDIEVQFPDELITKFEKEYVRPAAAVMDKFEVAHGVVASNDIHQFRQTTWDIQGKTIVIHQFKSDSHFYDFYQSDEYQNLIDVRRNLYHSNVIMFTLINDPPLFTKG
ncbi:uncharacterized protein LOC106872770 [Octopus bimaculoides]|uniref:DUF1330 domain-containing protein n=1 Tax=Octopus bimaculoides TaxID=37653 RepID=A0A0L8H552_OCTBM|nr:uncharacterized protein LOC106872770 [Octopus bimaculoides]XP_014775352.1 uncharacterized protein LOC106872770 [Octopus bimaculoides]XP_014775354.1 uncharacterized protein LOC106872770 [Octopus bimaculoides]XP_014775356.1 uncharacterized protein LOC106872770 [Octopus bimaculoides]XP_052826215.1 uncharacterized protein LOC106872770 [Octopus bimaculoides]|eukprot:XP_014775351.1 PREDICTED: uncharacterized protein LOC106872770 [Octopus bimaculoides]